MNAKTWLHSLIAAGVGGFSSSLLSLLAMPETFNFTHDGLIHVAKCAIIGTLVPVLTLLKQSPLPGSTVTVTTAITSNVTKG